MRQFLKILFYGVLFNAVFVGLPWTIDALKADTGVWKMTDVTNVWLQDEFRRNPPKVDPRDPLLIYSMLLGWVLVCGFVIQECKEQG